MHSLSIVVAWITCMSAIIIKESLFNVGMNRQAVAKRNSESSEGECQSKHLFTIANVFFFSEALVHTPQSPVNPPIHVVDETDSNAVIVIPPSPIRKNSDASRPTVPRYDWYQTEKNLMIHIFTHNKASTACQYEIVMHLI